MLNVEKYRDEILELSKTTEDIAVQESTNKVMDCGECICEDCKFNTFNSCSREMFKWLFTEYKEPILDEAEREYLSAMCKPFAVNYVVKLITFRDDFEFIAIDFIDGYIELPLFKINKMYKGMELGKNYTPQELGITCKNNPNGEIEHENC